MKKNIFDRIIHFAAALDVALDLGAYLGMAAQALRDAQAAQRRVIDELPWELRMNMFLAPFRQDTNHAFDLHARVGMAQLSACTVQRERLREALDASKGRIVALGHLLGMSDADLRKFDLAVTELLEMDRHNEQATLKFLHEILVSCQAGQTHEVGTAEVH